MNITSLRALMGGRDEVLRANVLDLAILVGNESARILKEPMATSLAPQNGATGGTSAHAHLPGVAGVDAMLRGNGRAQP